MPESITPSEGKPELLQDDNNALDIERSRLQLMTMMMRDLRAGLGLDATVNRLFKIVRDQTGASPTLYYLVSSDVFYANGSGAIMRLDAIDDPLVQKVLANRAFLKDLSDSTAPLTWLFPLCVGSELVAVLKIEDVQDQARVFEPQLTLFCDYAALVLKNAMQESIWRQRMDKALQEQEERYQLLFNSGSDAVTVHGLTANGMPDRYIQINDAACQRLGYTREEMLQLSPRSIVAPGWLTRVAAVIQKLLVEKHVLFEMEHVTRNGRRIPVEINAHLFHVGGEPIVLSIARDITERKQAEQALLDSEARYRLISELIFDYAFAWRFEPDGTMIFEWITGSFKHVTGYAWEEIDALGSYALYHPEDVPAVESDLEKVQAGQAVSAEYRIIAKSGDVRWVQIHRQPIWDTDQKRVVRFYGVAQDVTERKQAENALRESEERFRLVAQATNDALYDWDVRTNTIWRNDGYQRLLGLAEPVSNSPTWGRERVHPEDYEVVRTGIPALLAGSGDIWTMEYRVRRENGAYADVIDRGYVVRDAAGDAVRMVGAVIDITERKQAEARLKESEQNFRQLSEQALMGIAIIQDDRVKYVNLAASGISGYSADEMLSWRRTDFAGLIHPDDLNFMSEQAQIRQINKAAAFSHTAYRLVTKSGEYKWVDQYWKTIIFDGRPAHLITVLDMTEHKRAEAIIRESQQRLALLVEQSPIAVIEWAIDVGVISWNLAAERIFGYTREEALGRAAADRMTPEDIKPYIDGMWNDIVEHPNGTRNTNANITKDGRRIICEWYNGPLVNEEGQVIGVVSLASDITERTRAEEAMRERDRLQAALEKERELNAIKDNIMRTISHEFRTPLAVISTCSSLLTRYYAQLNDDQREKQIETIQGQVKKLDDMVGEIVSAVRGVFSEIVFQPRETDLELLAQLTIAELQSTVGATHAMRFEGRGQLQNVLADERLINRILVNLLSNAIKYSGQGSAIRLQIFEEDDSIVIQVIDQGIGISPDDQKRLFQPFFRGSNVGATTGMGLGLNIVRDCVTLHQGSIDIKSELNKGTTFTVRLPAHPNSSSGS